MSSVKVIESTLNDASTTDEIIATVNRETTEVVKKKVGFLADVESKALAQTFADLEDFDVGKMVTVLPRLMQHVEHYKNLSGQQKKELVISMVKHIIDITDGPGNDAFWDKKKKKLVPSLIDTFITISDGKLRLRKKKGWMRRLFACIFRLK